jgi:ATP-dependent Clp protease ATP-binding subunit ClpC
MSQELPLSAEIQRVLQQSRECTIRLNHRAVFTEHILLALLECQDAVVTTLLKNLGASPKDIYEAVIFVIGKGQHPRNGEPITTESVTQALDIATHEARQLNATELRPEHLLLGLIREQYGIASGILDNFGVTADRVRQQIAILQQRGYQRVAYAVDHSQRFQMTPTLNMVSRDLTAAALSGQVDPLIGRDYEVERTMQVLARRSKNNPVLIGSAGVGKTAIAEGLAQRIVQGIVPDNLKNQRVVALDVGLLTIGTKYRGDFEERLKKIMGEIARAHNLIIVVDELHTLIGAGVAEGSIDAANLLKPMLARGEFRCLGTTTLDDYRKTIERDPALERRFQPILVREPTNEETLAIVEGLRDRYQAYHHVTITDDALKAAVVLSARYIHSRQLPDKAIDLIDEAAARQAVSRSILPASVRVLQEKLDRIRDEKNSAIYADDFPLAASLWKQEHEVYNELVDAETLWRAQHDSENLPIIGEYEIASVVAAWTGIPAVKISVEESARLMSLEGELHQRIVGQDEAISSIARAIRRSRTEIRDARRPIGSFVFAGPTGVGKTELARTLAECLFGDEDALVTLDMSEFMEAHYAARLVGSPPGYVGYDQAGQLTEAVHRRPYSVILFDEIEKAHPRVYELLLQVLEDGVITDAKGKTVDFRNTIIIMTTNIGAEQGMRRGSMGLVSNLQTDRAETLNVQVRAALREIFRPELINRIDDTIIFHPLTEQHVEQITAVMLTHTIDRLADQHIALQLTDDARMLIAHRGYDPEYGARPLRRKIQEMVEDALAEMVLRGEIHAGDTLLATIDGDTLKFTITTPSPEPVGAATNMIQQ